MFCWVFFLLPAQTSAQSNTYRYEIQPKLENPGFQELSETMDWIEQKLLFYGYPLESFSLSQKEKKIKLVFSVPPNETQILESLTQKTGFGILPVYKFDDKEKMSGLFDQIEQGRIRDNQGRTIKLTSLFELNTTTIEGYDFRRFPPAVIGMAGAQDMETINQFLNKSEIQAILPPNAKFVWAEKASSLFKGKYDLYLANLDPQNELKQTIAASTKVYKKPNRYGRVRDLIDIRLPEGEYEAMTALSLANINRELLITYDGKALSAPLVQGAIRDGKLTIEGLFKGSEAIALSTLLRTASPDYEILIRRD